MIKEVVRKVEERGSDRGNREKGRGWWDEECMKKKKEVRRN